MRKFGQNSAFTVVEMLVVVAIIAALAAMASVGATSMIRKAGTAREVAALRKLIGGYLAAAADNDGILPAGYDKNAAGVVQRDGRLVSGEPAHRYPWRMMPYLDGSLTDALYVSRNRSQVNFDSDYLVSLYPSFGMNEYFVGGHLDGTTEKTMAGDCVTRLSRSTHPSMQLVFASARGDGTGKDPIQGYFKLTPPNLVDAVWTGSDEYDEKSAPDRYGHLDLRHDKHAACAFLDGHVALLDLKTLRDMRYWSSRAADENNPDYSVTPPAQPGRPGRN